MRLTALLALVAVSAGLAACGGSDRPKSGDAPSVLTSAKKAKVGSVIVDAQGRTLYRFTAEAQGLPVCTGACAGDRSKADANGEGVGGQWFVVKPGAR